jgi:hypothetical protein
MALQKDIKDIFKLSGLLCILIIIAWSISFFSGLDGAKRKNLFSLYEIQEWKAIEVNQVLYIVQNGHEENANSQLSFHIEPKQWEKIVQDFERITIIEENIKPPLQTIQEISLNPCLKIHQKKSQVSFCLGQVNESTGNFWIQYGEKFFLVQTDMYFEGLYQSELEGLRLSYQRLKSYFLEPFKNWYGKNLWSNVEDITLTTKKSRLFSLNQKGELHYPQIPQDMEVDIEIIKNYFSKLLNWIPSQASSAIPSDQALQNADFFIQLKLSNGLEEKFAIYDLGLWLEDKKIFFHAPKTFLEELIVLPEQFYQKKILSLSQIWENIKSKKISSIEWFDLSKSKTKNVIQNQEILESPKWQQFFCLFSACLSQGISVVMKHVELTETEFELQKKKADKMLKIEGQVYYFKSDTFRLEILTPQKQQFIFISRIKDIYP